MKYYQWTIGCQMNFADSRRAAEELDKLGYQQVDRPQSADLILLNTCVVRQSAEDKVTGRLTSLQGLKRRKPELKLALMGCYVNEIPALQHRYPWVDAFIKPSDVAAVVELAESQVASRPMDEALPAEAPSLPVSVGVPINQGCDHLCTYCIVRLRRGPEVSRPVAEIVAEVQGLVRRGVKEITLLGQNVDSYGHDLPVPASPEPPPAGADKTGNRPPDLADLLAAVHEIEDLARIRFLTSHPADMTDRLMTNRNG
ncbi:MAG: radical SAM protein [Anaerolineae bacterium]